MLGKSRTGAPDACGEWAICHRHNACFWALACVKNVHRLQNQVASRESCVNDIPRRWQPDAHASALLGALCRRCTGRLASGPLFLLCTGNGQTETHPQSKGPGNTPRVSAFRFCLDHCRRRLEHRAWPYAEAQRRRPARGAVACPDPLEGSQLSVLSSFRRVAATSSSITDSKPIRCSFRQSYADAALLGLHCCSSATTPRPKTWNTSASNRMTKTIHVLLPRLNYLCQRRHSFTASRK